MLCTHCDKDIAPGSRFCVECGADSAAGAIAAVTADPRIGTTLEGKYRLDSQIGVGGMATVYRACRLLIGDFVAVKILHAAQIQDPQAPERFRREAQAAARLKHPNAVTIYDFGVSEDGTVYLVMELIEGENLRKVIKEQGPLLPSVVDEILTQVCSALNEAHIQKVVHRDIKPDNIIVSPSPTGIRVKVLDFGIARVRDSSSLGNLTQTGSVMGTPHYMSPEQCLGEELDGRSDIYSLGVVLYELLAGVVPFNSPTSMAVVVQHVNQTPAPLRVLNASIPVPVESVVMHALEKRRETRPQTANALAQEFSGAVRGVSGVSPVAPVGTAGGGAAMTPTVQMQTPWSTAATMPPQGPTTQGAVISARSFGSRTPSVAVLLGGTAVVVAAAVLTWFLLSGGRAPAAERPGSAEAATQPAASRGNVSTGIPSAVPPPTNSPGAQAGRPSRNDGSAPQNAGTGRPARAGLVRHSAVGGKADTKEGATIEGRDDVSRKLAETVMDLLKERSVPPRVGGSVSLEISTRPGPGGNGITGDYLATLRTATGSHTFQGIVLRFGELPLRTAIIEEAATKIADFLAGLP